MSDKRYVLLDRDGTIIQDKHYLCDPEGVELIPGAAEGLRMLQDAGFGLVIVTNQSGVGRGYFDEESVARVHARLLELLAAEDVFIDGIFYCPHAPEAECGCRKPSPGMALDAASKYEFDPTRTFVVGDKPADVELGRAIGAQGILVLTGKGKQYEHTVEADFIAADLKMAAEYIVHSE